MSTFDRFEVGSPNWSDDAPPAVTATDHRDPRIQDIWDAIERLSQQSRPRDFTEMRWHLMLKDMRAFAQDWLDLALLCGWTAGEIFGVPTGVYQPYRAGLIFLLQGQPVEAIDEHRIVIANKSGPPYHFYRQTPGSSVPHDRSHLRPIWDRLAVPVVPTCSENGS